MSFESHSVGGGAGGRFGTLSLEGSAPIRTPTLFIDTRRLAIPHISHDIWEELARKMEENGSNTVLSVNVFDVLESVPVPALIEAEAEASERRHDDLPSLSGEGTRVDGRGSRRGTISLHKFSGFSNVPMLLHVVDPSTPFPAAPSTSKTMCSQREVGRMKASTLPSIVVMLWFTPLPRIFHVPMLHV
jgi:hypothetical protein